MTWSLQREERISHDNKTTYHNSAPYLVRTKLSKNNDNRWFLNFILNKENPAVGRVTKNWSIDSFCCSSPEKSLVKGERFVRGMKENQSLLNFQKFSAIKIRSTCINSWDAKLIHACAFQIEKFRWSYELSHVV